MEKPKLKKLRQEAKELTHSIERLKVPSRDTCITICALWLSWSDVLQLELQSTAASAAALKPFHQLG